MKPRTTKKPTNLQVRRSLVDAALVDVRKLVKKYDLPSVNSAVKVLYDERKADKELRDAEAKVAALRKKRGIT